MARFASNIMITAACVCTVLVFRSNATIAQTAMEERVVVESGGWALIGDLLVPVSDATVPAVLILNQAAGDRTAYVDLASELASRGVASLRLDLRGHGESTNLGVFEPGKRRRDPLIWDAESDVQAALRYLQGDERIRSDAVAVVGASYSGEEMAEAGRLHGYASAYVALSPGSFSEESIAGIDRSGQPWLFIVSNSERFLADIEADVRMSSSTVEMVILPGVEHASDLLAAHRSLAERIAVWLSVSLRSLE